MLRSQLSDATWTVCCHHMTEVLRARTGTAKAQGSCKGSQLLPMHGDVMFQALIWWPHQQFIRFAALSHLILLALRCHRMYVVGLHSIVNALSSFSLNNPSRERLKDLYIPSLQPLNSKRCTAQAHTLATWRQHHATEAPTKAVSWPEGATPAQSIRSVGGLCGLGGQAYVSLGCTAPLTCS